MASRSFRSFSLFWVEWVCIFVLLSSQHVFADEAKECPVGPLNLKPSDFNVVVTNGESRQWNLGPKGVRVSMTEELEQFSYDLHEACFMLSTEKEVKVLDVVLVGNCPVSLSFQLSHTKEQVESSLSLQRTYLMDSFGKLDADALTHHRLYIPGSVITTFQLQFTAVSTPCTINHLSLLYHNESVSFVSYLRDMNEAKKTALLLPIAEIPEEGGNYKQELARQNWISNSWNEATVTTTDVKVDHPYKYHITMPPSSVLSTTVPLPEKEKQEVVTLKAQLSVKYCKEHAQSTESALLSAFVTAIQSNPQGEQLTTYLSMVSVYRELYHFIEEDCQETLFNMLPNYSRIPIRVSVVAPQPVNFIKLGVCTGPANDDDSFHIFDMSLGRYGEPETILQPGGTPTHKESIPVWGIALLVVFSIIIIMVIPCSLLLCHWYRKTQSQQFRVLQPGYVDHDDMETMGANADLELEMGEH